MFWLHARSKLLHDCKIEPKDFWIKVANYAKQNHCDPTLAYLMLLEQHMRAAGLKVNAETFKQATKYAKGAIIGSAFVNHLTENGINNIDKFVSSILDS